MMLTDDVSGTPTQLIKQTHAFVKENVQKYLMMELVERWKECCSPWVANMFLSTLLAFMWCIRSAVRSAVRICIVNKYATVHHPSPRSKVTRCL